MSYRNLLHDLDAKAARDRTLAAIERLGTESTAAHVAKIKRENAIYEATPMGSLHMLEKTNKRKVAALLAELRAGRQS